ncbi:hypothetical protein, partial [Bacillus altitudinis]
PAEGIGLENRQGCQSPRGFESLFLRHIDFTLVELKRIKIGNCQTAAFEKCSGFFYFVLERFF